MKGGRVDPARRRARVSPGCTQGDVDHASVSRSAFDRRRALEGTGLSVDLIDTMAARNTALVPTMTNILTFSDIAEKARICGADDYMGKPFEFDDLIRLVKKYARAQS